MVPVFSCIISPYDIIIRKFDHLLGVQQAGFLCLCGIHYLASSRQLSAPLIPRQVQINMNLREQS
jgi:hypothetical protein